MLSSWMSIKSDGSIGNDRPITLFQYRHYINWEVPLIMIGMDMKRGVGRWKFRIVSQTGEVLFEQSVELIIDCISLGSLGLELFTWMFEKETITTTVVNGVPARSLTVTVTEDAPKNSNIIKVQKLLASIPKGVSLIFGGVTVTLDAEAPEDSVELSVTPTEDAITAGTSYLYEDNPPWKYTLGGTKFSEFGTMETGGGSDYTNAVAYINDWWDSPVYRLNLPVGCKFVFVMDSWSLGAKKRVEWQTRYETGTYDMAECRYGRFGELVRTHVIDGAHTLSLVRSWGRSNLTARGAIFEGVTDPSILVMPDGRYIIGVMTREGYHEYISVDLGRSAQRAEYPAESVSGLAPKEVFDAGVTMPRLVSLGQKRVALAVRGTELISRTIDESGLGPLVVVGKASGQSSYSMDIDPDGALVVVDASGDIMYTSQDTGTSWQGTDEE